MRSDIVSRQDAGEFWVCKDISVLETLRIGRTITLMHIYEHERDLNRGRFEHFDREAQRWPATIRLKDDSVLAERQVSRMVNWIAEQIDTPWSLDIEVDFDPGTDTYKDYARFSFEDSDLGVMFKIVFS